MPDLKQTQKQLEEMADLLELKEANPFRLKAFRTGARAISLSDVSESVTQKELLAIPGIGKGLAPLIEESIRSGTIQELDALREEFPLGVREMLQLRSFGPSKVKAVWKELGISSVGELAYACRENRLVRLKGFGEKIQSKTLESIELFERNRGKQLLPKALKQMDAFLAWCLEKGFTVQMVGETAMGSCTVSKGQVALMVDGNLPEDLAQAPGSDNWTFPEVNKSLAKLEGGLFLEVHGIPKDQFLSYCLWESSSPDHQNFLSAKASEKGITFTKEGFPLWPHTTETAVYEALGYHFISPECREPNLDPERFALSGPPPNLVSNDSIRGVFHNHTRASDGANSLEDMVQEALRLGYDFIGISEHSQASYVANGLSAERLLEQAREVKNLQAQFPQIKIFHGVECDILPDGSLDYEDDVLASLDFVVASVHGWMNQPEADMTKRLCRAIAHPSVTMLGHPTGRLLLARNPYQVDMDAVLTTAKQHGKSMELNANPRRLDLGEDDLRTAQTLGVPICINPDAHSLEGLDHTRWGVLQARKAGLCVEDVWNACTLKEMENRLAASKAG